jgi:very-short-patch-repair endonuclease
LRDRQIEGARFRRQHPIGRYVVDFVCLERRLIVEVDGGQHTQEEQIAHNVRRDQWLEAGGYRVLRVPTVDVYGNIAGVVDTIWAALQEMPLVRRRRHSHQERHRTWLAGRTRLTVAKGKLSPWRSILPPLRVEGDAFAAGEGRDAALSTARLEGSRPRQTPQPTQSFPDRPTLGPAPPSSAFGALPPDTRTWHGEM